MTIAKWAFIAQHNVYIPNMPIIFGGVDEDNDIMTSMAVIRGKGSGYDPPPITEIE
jgi:hypothetical protein